jgi:beta-lactamase regulating signal transducer with metallopeptidase domain
MDSSLRVSLVAVSVGIILLAVRVRSSAVRHAAWTAVTCAMILMPILPYCVPQIAIPVISSSRGVDATSDVASMQFDPGHQPNSLVAEPSQQSSPALAPVAARESNQKPLPTPVPIWPIAVSVVYIIGVLLLLFQLALGWRGTARIAETSAEIEPAEVSKLMPFGAALIRESRLVATPLTIGIFSQRIILPTSWRHWPDEKLRAVLAHEFAHVQRRDFLVGLLAHLNRCLFWFHPLAWWLERKLAVTAEHACDDAAVRAIGKTRHYAEVLLDMAESVRRTGSRFSWQGVGVGGTGLLDQRIDRILRGDLLREVSRTRKAVVAVSCALAIFLIVACRRQPQPPAPLQRDPQYVQLEAQQKAMGDFNRAAHGMNRQQVRDLEASLKTNPENLDALKKLLEFYVPIRSKVGGEEIKWAPVCTQVIGENECIAARRLHILWLIEHHPERKLAGEWEARIFPTTLDPLADPTGYAQAKKLWLEKTSPANASIEVLRNAAWFFEVADKPLAEKMMLRAQSLDPKGHWFNSLGRLYALVLVGSNSSTPGNAVGTVSMEDAHGHYAQEIRKKLSETTDVDLLAGTAEYLLLVRSPYMLHKIDFDPIALAKSYCERALQLNPEAASAQDVMMMIRAGDRNSRLSAILLGVPKALKYQTISALPDAQRFEFIPDLAIEDYMFGEFIVNSNNGTVAHSETRGLAVSTVDASGTNLATSGPMMNQTTPKLDEAIAKVYWEHSRGYAQDLLRLAPKFRSDPNYGVAVYMGNIVLGTLALREGNRKAAVDYLLAASHAPAAQDLDMYIPHHLRLTGYLLKYGERESVIEFLERIAQVSRLQKASLLEAAGNIRKGLQPIWYPRENTNQAPGR